MGMGSFKGAVAGLFGGLLLAAAAPSATALAQAIELKLSHYLPPSNVISKELDRWAAELEQKSNGRLKIAIFGAGQMGPPPRQYDLARTGVADMAYLLHGFLPGRFALTELAHLPNVFDRAGADGKIRSLSVAEASAIVTGLTPELTPEHTGTKPLFIVACPTVSPMFKQKEVRTPADAKGLRIRHNGPIGAAMVESWGASPAAVAPAELGDAIQKGTIDGMLFNYEAAQSFQIGGDIRNVTELNSATATFALVINQKRYDALPADLRALIDQNSGVETARRIGALYDKAEAEGREYVVKAGVKITVPTEEERKAFRDAAAPVVERTVAGLEAKNLPAKAVLQKLRAAVAGAGQ